MTRISKKLVGMLLVVSLVLGMASFAFAEKVTMNGTLSMGENGYVLTAGDTKLPLEGDVNADLEGKEVVVVGEKAKGEDGKEYIVIESVNAK